MISLIATLPAGAPAGSAVSVWPLVLIAFGIVAVTTAFAYVGRLAMRSDAPAPASAGFLGEIDLKPIPGVDRDTDDERAFASIARRFGLKREQKTMIRRIARSSGTPASAMLISEHAFDAALARAQASAGTAPDGADAQTITRLRARLFAE